MLLADIQTRKFNSRIRLFNLQSRVVGRVELTCIQSLLKVMVIEQIANTRQK